MKSGSVPRLENSRHTDSLPDINRAAHLYGNGNTIPPHSSYKFNLTFIGLNLGFTKTGGSQSANLKDKDVTSPEVKLETVSKRKVSLIFRSS